MLITKLKIGVYFQAQMGYAFCVYYFPVNSLRDSSNASESGTAVPSDPDSPSSETNFYRLRDLDVMFFRKEPGYMQGSGKFQAKYLNSSAHHFRENTGDVYMSSTAIGEAAKRLGNYLLAEFCVLSREAIKNGVADEMFKSIPAFNWKHPFTESEEDLDALTDGDEIPGTTTPDPHAVSGRDGEDTTWDARANSGDNVSPTPMETDSAAPVLEKNTEKPPRTTGKGTARNGRRKGQETPSKQSGTCTRSPSPIGTPSKRANETESGRGSYKQPAPQESGLKRARSDAELSEAASVADKDTSPPESPRGSEDSQSARPRQRKRLSINTAVAHSLPGSRQSSASVIGVGTASGSVDVMEQMRSTLKLKQQQQAIIDSRQNAHRGPMSADTRASTGGVASSPRESFGGKGASSRQPPSPRYRNSKNLTIWTGESAASGSSSRGGAMTAPVDGPAHAPPTVLHPGRRHDSPSNASLLSPRHLNPAPGKSSKIGSRGMEASRYNIPLHSNSISASNQQLVSPRAGEFPSRELPLPPHMHQHRDRDASDRETHGRSPLPIAQAHNGSSGSSKHLPSIAPPPQSPSTGYGTGPGGLHSNSALPFSRSNFLGLCESLFDQTDESFRLQSTLRDQIRRSTAMLQTLQSSGQMIEGLVRSHFREMQVQYGEKFGFALTDLNRRLASVEEKLGLSNAASNQRGGGGGGGGGASNAGSTTSNEPSSSSIPSHVAHWGFRGGPPSANVNGTGFSFGLAREEGGDGKAATPGVEGLLRGLMERLEKLEGKSGDTAATGDGEIVESKSE